jgi:PhnB protein
MPKRPSLLAIARDLRDLPRPEFKARLKSELERKALMATTTESMPAVRQTAAPRLRIRNCAAAIEFYKKAFDARELSRFELRGSIPHAEIAIGNSLIMLGEEALEYGYPGPQTLGGSPVTIQIQSDDVDAALDRAVAAGATLVMPAKDQFYGERAGTVLDPFGYTWGISTHKEDVSLEEMHRRLAEMDKAREREPGVPYQPARYQSLMPYLVAEDAAGLVDFVTQVFGGKEEFRSVGSAGGYHCELRVGDTMLMIGGGGSGVSWKGQSLPTALHIYVEDTDAVYRRALEAGAESIGEPKNQDYGERSASVKDRAGNHWYVASALEGPYKPEGLRNVNAYLHPRRAEPVIRFLQKAFGATELEKYASPDGVIHHAKVKVGDTVIEMGEAHGPYQPMAAMFYLYVPDVDATHHRAQTAGAKSIQEPANQPYGDRVGAVKDPFDNLWYLATHIKDAG